MNIIKKAIGLCMAFVMLLPSTSLYAAEYKEQTDAKSVILIEAESGTVLYEKNADEALPPASVTKIMTLLLVFEEIDSGNLKMTDMVQASEYAASMGGSQVFLKVGEEMSVEDMIKSVTVASANDCTVALAEHICGSESSFVEKMNKRAKELGMDSTTFKNTNGLDDTDEGHLTSARDIAIMSRELLKHKAILNYSTIWMDTIRNGQFGLTNTNRLIRFYKGANGLKTGSTSKAKFCISATAKRDNMQLIAVIMGSPNRDTRNEIAKSLFDFGFANYAVVSFEEKELPDVIVEGSLSDSIKISYKQYNSLFSKEDVSKVEQSFEIPDKLYAPVKEGDVIGKVIYKLNGEQVGEADIIANESAEKISFGELLKKMLLSYLLCE